MSNPLFQQLQNSNNNNLVQRFQQFKKTFQGNPQETIQQMLNNGQITQQQVNNAMQMAEQLKGLMK